MSQPAHSDAEYDAVADAAAHWCMRLQADDCTDGERNAFQRWLQENPLHAEEFAAMQEIWALSEQLPPSVHKEPTACQVAGSQVNTPALPHLSPAPSGHRRPADRRRRFAQVAALALVGLPLAGYIGWYQGWVPDGYESYETHDNTRLVTMADGSRVELNLNTRLNYLNFRDRRSITLNSGEAFFEVAHDSQHPFTVRAGRGSVTVTGTRFNVWLYEEQVRVMLLEGSVLVASDSSHPGQALRLVPGMQASYKPGDDQPAVSQTVAGDTTLAWRQGKLVFNDMPLNQALPLINRYLDKPLRLADATVGNLRLGGSFNTRDVDSLVDALPRVLPVKLTRDSNDQPVIGQRPAWKPKF